MSDARTQRDIARRLEQTQVKEVPGGISGFDTFYETGSFTPTWVGTGTAGTFSYTANQCLVEWTRIGNRLFYSGRIVITVISVAPTGNLQLAGWPYPGVADTNMTYAGGGPMTSWSFNVAAGYTDVGVQFLNGSSLPLIPKSGDNLAISAVAGSELIVGDCRFEGQYRIA
jgi:hypothetical protein